MLSIEKCNTILKNKGTLLDLEEIKEVRDYLYFLAELQVEAEKNKRIETKRNDECDNL